LNYFSFSQNSQFSLTSRHLKQDGLICIENQASLEYTSNLVTAQYERTYLSNLSTHLAFQIGKSQLDGILNLVINQILKKTRGTLEAAASNQLSIYFHLFYGIGYFSAS
jgi:hypothetical protein